jgi:hypothetical protein
MISLLRRNKDLKIKVRSGQCGTERSSSPQPTASLKVKESK